MITSGQPSLNPRLVKEADSLVKAGYDVTVLYAYWNEWGTRLDESLLFQKKWKAIRVAGDPKQNPFLYFLSRIIYKLSLFIAAKSGLKYFAEFAAARASYFLIRAAKKHTADLYIGHNLGALPAAVKAAKQHQKLCGFDAEDFHRNEVSDDSDSFDVRLKTCIEDKYLSQVSYLSASSPGIGGAYRQLYKDMSPVVLLNVFPVAEILPRGLQTSGNIRLFWFSQVIGPGRGLNDCIEALHHINNTNIELHLLGFATDGVKKRITNMADGNVNITFHEPVSPDDIPALAAQFDIGLALEDTSPRNRDICLTNKIFTYMQAGLAVIASDTSAQQNLLSEYPGVGRIYQKSDIKTLAADIEYYAKDRNVLNDAKKASAQLARTTLNWEKESEKFLKLIKDTLAG